MKLTKLMLSASIAALALVSCNKQDTTPTPAANRLKSVEVSLENIVFTKGAAGEPITNNQPITVKSFQIFLTDNAGNEYTGKVADGSTDAQSYWSGEELALTMPHENAQFHYVNPNCTKVVAVANMPQKYESYAAFKTALANLKIEDQQDQDNLALYDESSDFVSRGTHTDAATDANYVSEMFEVKLELTPRVSRFEIDGFSVKFNDQPKYNEIKISQVAFQKYYPETELLTGTETGDVVLHMPDFTDQSQVYTWLDTPENPQPWYRDYCDLTITPTAPTKDLTTKVAYHIFSGTEVPTFVIKLTADGQPAYLYTQRFRKASDDSELTEFQEGYIYRMSAAGEVKEDGTIEIPEEKIDPMDRCLDITVDVKKWQVDLVYPEF